MGSGKELLCAELRSGLGFSVEGFGLRVSGTVVFQSMAISGGFKDESLAD